MRTAPTALLKLNRDQLRWMIGLFTGHCHLKGHLFKLGQTYDPTCLRCLEKADSAIHIQCDCEAIAYLTLCGLRTQSLLKVADRLCINTFLEHDKLQHIIHLSGATQMK